MKKEEYTYKWYLFGCKDAGYLHEKKNDKGLTFGEKILYNFHMATCKMCRKYVKQLRIIKNNIHTIFHEISMDPKTKDNIRQKIKLFLK